MDHDELGAWLRLTLTPGIGNGAARRLLARFGLPQAIFQQTEAALQLCVPAAQAKALREIPPGVTTSYGELAQRIGAPRAVRAVAGACAANALAVAIPCHRVVRHDGSVSGYRWGVARKHALLAREAQQKEAPED